MRDDVPVRFSVRFAIHSRNSYIVVDYPIRRTQTGGGMSEPSFNHPSDDVLRALFLGQLSELELARVSVHLGDCPACCGRIDQLGTDDQLVKRIQKAAANRDKALVPSVQRRSAVRALDQSHETARAPEGEFASVNRPAPLQVGDYDILAEIGRGGMGVVYKARHRGLHRLAALKMVLAGEFASPSQELRFRLEAELAARVQHPNIVQVYEIGSYEGRPFLALEWVDGGSLANQLDGKPWPPDKAAMLIETLARAIDLAHGQGVVHRDLKPANILLAVEGDGCRVSGGTLEGESDEDSKLQGTGGLAVGDGPGGGVLPRDKGLSEGGIIRNDESDPAVRGLDSGEHCGESGPGAHRGIPPAPEHRTGLADGTGDARDSMSARRIARRGQDESATGTDRAHQPNALRPAQSVRKAPLTTEHAPPSTLHPKIADFGLAQPIEGGQTLTQSGFLVGTPGYMAPEQASGKRALVGPATDIYALGVMLYQLLTGQLPFQRDSTLELLRAVTSEEPTRLRRHEPRVPRDLEAITLHCLEKEPGRRYPSALALAEDLERFREGKQVMARPVGAVARLARACRRRPLVAMLVALLTTSMLGGLAGVTWKWLEANEQRDLASHQRDLANAHSRQADAEKQAALYQAYRASLTAASAALANHDVADSARHLASAQGTARLGMEALGQQA